MRRRLYTPARPGLRGTPPPRQRYVRVHEEGRMRAAAYDATSEQKTTYWWENDGNATRRKRRERKNRVKKEEDTMQV